MKVLVRVGWGGQFSKQNEGDYNAISPSHEDFRTFSSFALNCLVLISKSQTIKKSNLFHDSDFKKGQKDFPFMSRAY